MDARSQQQIDPLWSLVDPLTVLQAAALVAGIDPDAVAPDNSDNYRPVLAALSQAVIAGSLPAVIRRTAWERGWDEEPAEGERITKDVTIPKSDADEWGEQTVRAKRRGIVYRVEPDWNITTVARADVTKWLASRGHTSGFFFPEGARAHSDMDFLDPTHPRHPPKAVAGYHAWIAVGDTNGRTHKQKIKDGLYEHASEYELTGEDGRPIEKAIEEIAKVWNWDLKGGAPKTPEE